MATATPATSDQISAAEQAANAIAAASTTPVATNSFIFFAGFDGTNNDRDNLAVSGNAQGSAVDQIEQQVEVGNANNQNVVAKYYRGVGTPGTEFLSSLLPTDQSIETAQRAYDDFAAAAYVWRNDRTQPANADAPISAMIASFSRGTIAGTIFEQMLYEGGLVYTDKKTGLQTQLIPPGQAIVSANLMVSPVATGGPDNLEPPPSMQNVIVVDGDNEYRSLYHQSTYDQAGATNVLATGNHGDIGDIYDNGLGGIYLQGYTSYFANSGLSIAPVPPARQFDPNAPIVIHTETASPLAPWNLFTDGSLAIGSTSALIDRSEPDSGACNSDGTDVTSFVDYKGDTVQTTSLGGVTMSIEITPRGATTGTVTYTNPNPPAVQTVQNSDGSTILDVTDAQGQLLQSTITLASGEVDQTSYRDGVVSGYTHTLPKAADGSQTTKVFEADGTTLISATVVQQSGDFIQTQYTDGASTGSIRSTQNVDGSTTLDRLDGSGALQSSTRSAVDGSYTETEYDAQGQVSLRTSMTTTDGATRVEVEDGQGNALSTSTLQTNPDGTSKATVTYGDGGPTTVITTDAANNSTQIDYTVPSDPNVQTITQRDATGAVTSVQTITQATDSSGAVVSDTYATETTDGTGTITSTGSIQVGPADGSRTVTTITSATADNPEGTLQTTYFGANGEALPVSVDTINNVASGVSALYDAYQLVNAIQNHQTLPALQSGVMLANSLSGNTVPVLADASSALGVVSGLLGLSNALKTGNLAGGVVSAANLAYSGASLYAAATDQTVVGAFGNSLGGAVNAVGDELPYAGAFLDLAHGNVSAAMADAAGVWVGQAVGASLAATGAIAGSVVPVVGTVVGAIVGYVLGSLFASGPPTPWGSTTFVWSNTTGQMTVNTLGDDAGQGQPVAQNALLEAESGVASLVSAFDTANAANPNAQLGLIANRLGSISYGQTTVGDDANLDLHVGTVDPATGQDPYPTLRFTADPSHTAENVSTSEAVYFQNLDQFYLQNALSRQAVAPQWEVQTAQLQTQHGLTDAGLSEVERAADQGKLATPIAAGATTEDFNPIGLDLGGGLATTSLAQSNVQFDVDGLANLSDEVIGQSDPHYLKNTAWLNSTDGFLVLDKNLNGTIDDGEEMFSNSRVSEQSRGIASLQTVDANGSGVIDASDPVFSHLLVWRDANGDGKVEAGEAVSLASLGITSLNYEAGTFTQTGQTAPRQMSTLTLQASTTGNAYTPTAGGIEITSTNGQTSIAVTQVGDLSSLQAGEDSISTEENTAVTVLARGTGGVQGLLDNDQVSNAPNALLDLTGVSDAEHGTVSFDASAQSVTFTPEAGYAGTDAGFDYSVDAGPYGQATAHVQVNVSHVDVAPHITGDVNNASTVYGYTLYPGSPPSGAGDSYSPGTPDNYVPFNAPGTGYANTSGGGYGYQAAPQPDPLSGTATATDADDPTSSLTWSIASQGHDGIAQVNAQTGAWTFTDTSAVTGTTDAFVLKVTDPSGLSDQIQINVPLFPAAGTAPAAGDGGDHGDGDGAGAGDSPIIVDLNGTGFHFTSVDDSNVFLQQAADGWRHQTAWFGGGNGVLAVDTLGDGIIHDSSQISFTAYLPSAQTDLQGLAAFDSNHDGVINNLDARWGQLGVWVDANQDGISEPGEFKSLDALGITSLSLTSNDQFSVNNGVTVHGISSFTRADGSTGETADVTLQHSGEIQLTNPDGTTSIKQLATGIGAQGGPIVVGAGNNLVLGNAGNNLIQVGDGNNVVITGSGDDVIATGNGNNTVETGDGKDVVTLGNGDNTVFLGAGPKLVLAGSGNNVIVGGSGNSELFGGSGNDVIYAGTGNSLLYGGNGNNTLVGGVGYNGLVGGDGDDTLMDGGGRADMAGGMGNDTYVVTNAADTITENANGGIDTVEADIDYTLGANLENLTLTGHTALTGTGNELDNVLIGNGAADTLIGGAGNDTLADCGGAATLIGGTGDDTYIVANPGTTVVENAGEGNDTVKTSVSYALPANVETLIGTGLANLTLTGGSQDGVTIQANDGTDTLVAGAGVATLMGGSGDDTFVVDNASDVVVAQAGLNVNTILTSISYAAVDNVTVLTGTGSANITLSGNALQDVVTANAGNDTLIAGAGNTEFIGGAGTDSYQLFNESDEVQLGGGLSNVQGGDGNIAITGNSQGAANIALGNGANQIDLSVNNNGNSVSLGHGDNIVALGGGANGVSLGTGSNTVHAGDGANAITAHDVAGSQSFLTVGDGNDTLKLGDGSNSIIAGNGADTITAGNGNNVITAGAGSDTITLGGGNNRVTASNGTDVFNAGDGGNTVALGSGADIVKVGNGNNSVTTADIAGGADTVQAGNGSNQITVGQGNDRITLGNGDNTVNAGSGGNTVSLGTGSNSVTLGNGSDALTALDATGSQNKLTLGNGSDTVMLGGGNNQVMAGDGADVVKAGDGSNTVALGSGTDSVTLGHGSNSVNTADAAGVVDTIQVGNGNNQIAVGQGNDRVTVGSGNNILGGGNGADTVALGAGSNTVTLGNGNDALTALDVAGSQNKLTLGNGSDTVKLGGGNNTVALGAGTDSVTLGNGTNNVSTADAAGVVDTIQAGNGNNQVVVGQGNDRVTLGNGSNTLGGGNGADTVALGTGSNTVTLGNGADTVTAQDLAGAVDKVTLANGNDIVNLGNGSSTVVTGNGNSQVQVGNGNNSVTVGNGANTLTTGSGVNALRVGTGADIIVNHGGTDSLYFAPGVTADSLSFGASGADLLITEKATGGSVRIVGGYTSASAAISQFVLGDGNYGVQLDNHAYTLVAGNGTDTVTGGAGNDNLTLGNGADTVQLGNGNDRIVLGSGSNTVTVGNGTDTVTSKDALGSQDKLTLGAGNDTVSLGNGNNSVTAGNGADTVTAGNGANALSLGSGRDSVTVGNGNNSVTTADIAGGADTIQAGNGNNLLTVGQGNDRITLGNGNSTVVAGNGNNQVQVGSGNNSIKVGKGANTLTTGSGVDALHVGVGKDTVYNQGGTDTVYFDPTVAVDTLSFGGSGADLLVTEGITGGSIRAVGGYTSLAASIAQFVAGNGNYAVQFDDHSYNFAAGNGIDNVFGGAGSDAVTLGNGNDTVVLGNGNDTVTVGSGVNGISLGNGNNKVVTGNGANAVLAGNGANTIALGAGWDAVALGNGNNSVTTADASGGADAIYAGNGNNAVNVGQGNDRIALGNGANSVFGGNGNNAVSLGNGSNAVTLGNGANTVSIADLGSSTETVRLGNGNNTVTLGKGADTLAIGNGNNTIVLGSGHNQASLGNGSDSIVTIGGTDAITLGSGHYDLWNSGGSDSIALTAGAYNKLWFQQKGSDLEVSVLGSNETLTVHQWFLGASTQTALLTSSDGHTINAAGINKLVQAMASFTAPVAMQTSYTAPEQLALAPVLSANWH